MISLTKSKVIMLCLMSMILLNVYATAPVDQGTSSTAACTTNSATDTRVSMGTSAGGIATTGNTYGCVPTANLVANCYYYDIADDSICYCRATQTKVAIVSNDFAKGCVPKSQYKINSKCTYNTAAKTFACACPTGFTKVVPISTENNSDLIAEACTDTLVPNCKTYKVNEAAGSEAVTLWDSTDNGYNIVCKTCAVGADAYAATAGTFDFIPLSGDTLTTSEACPIDGFVDTSCTKLQLTTDKLSYEAVCSSGTAAKFVTSPTQLKGVFCVADAQLVVDCEKYNYHATAASITCAKCPTGRTQVTVNGDVASSTWKICKSNAPIGCSIYWESTLTTSIKPADTMTFSCVTCTDTTNWDLVPTSITSAPLGTTTDTGVCVIKGRFQLLAANTGCTYYASGTDPKTINELTCGMAPTAGTYGTLPPFVLAVSSLAGGCTDTTAGAIEDGAIEVQVDGTNTCVATGLINACLNYNDVKTANGASSVSYDLTGGCKACKTGYFLADSTYSLGDATLKPCIPDAKKVDGCSQYNHDNFTCALCENRLKVDSVNNICPTSSSATAACVRAVSVGSVNVCITCSGNYTLINGVCALSVAFCANLGTNGQCGSCISGYQLISNKCIKKPANCDFVNAAGQCVACKAGFSPNTQGQCTAASSNTCPSGQYPSNGACTPVPLTIPSCIKYTTDGSKCEQCSQGKTPATNGLSCVTPTSSGNSGLKPCPANTSKVTYRRNPSNPTGDCVAVDVQCANARDDGFCFSCKNNEYAHTDGKCYKVTAVDGSN